MEDQADYEVVMVVREGIIIYPHPEVWIEITALFTDLGRKQTNKKGQVKGKALLTGGLNLATHTTQSEW